VLLGRADLAQRDIDGASQQVTGAKISFVGTVGWPISVGSFRRDSAVHAHVKPTVKRFVRAATAGKAKRMESCRRQASALAQRDPAEISKIVAAR
jgi:hypothetical protein